MFRFFLVVGVTGSLAVMSAGPAQAQSGESGTPPVYRIHLGPLALAPEISLANAGVDTNVFRDREAPKRDTTMTLRPQALARLRIGRAQLFGEAGIDYVYFQQYHSERSVDTNDRVAFEIPLNRISVSGSYSFLRTRQPLNSEIDARARRVEDGGAVTLEARLGAKTSVAAGVGRATTSFRGDAVLEGTRLDTVLNRESRSANTAVRYALTPLTQLVVAGEAERVRFDFLPLRDSESLRVMPGIEFKPTGLLRGSASVGYQQFDIADRATPDFNGLVAAVDLDYFPSEATRLGIGFARDVEYSWRLTEPYYLRSGVTASVTRRLGGTWRIRGSAGVDWRDYQPGTSTVDATSGERRPLERVWIYGLNLGYNVGQSTNVSLGAVYHRRHSSFTVGRAYELLRIGTTITYGFN